VQEGLHSGRVPAHNSTGREGIGVFIFKAVCRVGAGYQCLAGYCSGATMKFTRVHDCFVKPAPRCGLSCRLVCSGLVSWHDGCFPSWIAFSGTSRKTLFLLLLPLPLPLPAFLLPTRLLVPTPLPLLLKHIVFPQCP